MSRASAGRSVYHITHVENLPSILARDGLWSDRELLARATPHARIGLSKIKRRRLERLRVPCVPGAFVGDFVPFYFCPRSVMLYVIHRGHEELEYRGGQDPIVHLVVGLDDLLEWARAEGVPWAASTANAGANYAQFFADARALESRLDWKAIASRYFTDPDVKAAKQAEFLVHRHLPWTLVRDLGVRTFSMAEQVGRVLGPAAHRPPVRVLPHWYF